MSKHRSCVCDVPDKQPKMIRGILFFLCPACKKAAAKKIIRNRIVQPMRVRLIFKKKGGTDAN